MPHSTSRKVRRIDEKPRQRQRTKRVFLGAALRARPARMIAAIALLIFLAWFLLFLFQPGPKYELSEGSGVPIDSPEFLPMLEALADAHFEPGNAIDVLPNGEQYYPAELEAIRAAKQSVTLEAYIFQRGRVADDFIGALTDRARAGVKVNLVLDGVGSLSTTKGAFDDLIAAGGRVEFYHPLRWYSWPRYNNRTHRELIVIDGHTAFVGGSGFADHWLHGADGHPRWRDTMFRVRGPVANRLQGTFVENWVEASGEVLNSPAYFARSAPAGPTPILVVNSTPSQGSSTRARILYQALLGSAKRRIYVTTPYFLPDRSLMNALITAKRDRGLDVKVLVPGQRSDHFMTRASSRGLYGKLLEAGIEIYEYQPAMLHAKVLLVDDDWVVVGSTNFDNRSFGLNDEINLCAKDAALAQRLTQDFHSDLSESHRVTLDDWRNRPYWQRLFEWAGWLISRHQ